MRGKRGAGMLALPSPGPAEAAILLAGTQLLDNVTHTSSENSGSRRVHKAVPQRASGMEKGLDLNL